MTETIHRVTWDGNNPTFHCDGDSASACHQYPSCEHEYWPCEHPFEPHEQCWKLPWLDASPEDSWFSDELVRFDEMPRIDGPIETEWEGECLLWCYGDDE